MSDNEKSGVDELKDKLYSRKSDIKVGVERAPLHPESPEVPPTWSELHPVEPQRPLAAPLAPRAPRTGMSAATKFFLGSFVFFVLAIVVAVLMFFGGGNTISPQNIDMEIVTPSLIDGGKEATFQIIITNRNQSDLELADLLIDYPEGTRSTADPSQSFQHERQSIGTIRSGEQIKRTASGIFYGQEGAEQKIKTTLQYNVAGSNAVFERQAESTFVVGSSPVSLSIKAPAEAISGDQLAFDVEVRSNAAARISNVVVQGQYPFGFQVVSSNPSADAGGTIWRIGNLEPGAVKVIHLVGTINGQDGDERVFRFLAGSNTDPTDTQIKIPYLTMPHTLTIHRPFVTGTIAVEGKSTPVVSVSAGKRLSGSVSWQNNLSDSIQDVELVLTLTGPALDKNSVDGDGFYQSSNSSIIWTKAQNPSLGSVPPGGGGTLHFNFATLPPGAGNVLITNPTVSLNLQVRGTRVGENNVPESVSSAASLKVQLSSAAEFAAQTLYRTGPFANSGPQPPRAETPTTYTIQWTVKNSSNTLANTNVSAVLPPYVQFVAAQGGSGITYDAPSRTVRWALGELSAGVGYTSAARQAAFQISFTPSTSQINSAPQLTGTATLVGSDRFAQVQVEARAEPPTTNTSSEGGFLNGMDIVQPK